MEKFAEPIELTETELMVVAGGETPAERATAQLAVIEASVNVLGATEAELDGIQAHAGNQTGEPD